MSRKLKRTGFNGVEIWRDRFRAICSRKGVRSTIGVYERAEDAARAVDEFLIEKVGIGYVYDKLNFPAEHLAAYKTYLKSLRDGEKQQAELVEQQMLLREIPESRFSELQHLFYSQISVEELARKFEVHPQVVIATLRKLHEERQRILGISPSELPNVSNKESVMPQPGRKTIVQWLHK